MKAAISVKMIAALAAGFVFAFFLVGFVGPQTSAFAAEGDETDGSSRVATLAQTDDETAASDEEEEEKKRLERIRKLREELARLEAAQKTRDEADQQTRTDRTGTPIAPSDEVEIEGTPMMPVPPTGQGRSSDPFLLPADQGPRAPTAFGTQDGFPGGTGMMAPGMMAPGGMQGPSPTNLLAPPTSNPSASAGAASMDPAMGRYASFAVPQAMGELGTAGKPSALGAATKDKPFANYTPPRAISPYINLYRDPAGGVDNYNAYVRPIIEQQELNVQTQYEVSKLQRTSRAQTSNLQMLDRRLNPYMRELSSPTTRQGPAQFMNLQHYYPALRGRR